MKKKVLVVNQYNSDNLGDKLLNSVLCNKLLINNINVSNAGFAQTTEQNISYENVNRNPIQYLKQKFPERLKYRFKYRKRLNQVTKKINANNYNALIIGGGQLLKHGSVFLDCLNHWVSWAENNELLICIYGVGIDNNLNSKERIKYKEIISKADYINCRDLQSLEILSNLIEDKSIKFSPDIAFSLNYKRNDVKIDNLLIMPYSYETCVRAFGLNLTREDYYNEILSKFKNEIGNNKILLSATTTSDAIECKLFKKYLYTKGIDSELLMIKTSEDLVKVISESLLVVTGRMHAMIISEVVGTRIKPILISDKINQFVNEHLNSQDLIDEVIYKSALGLDDLSRFIKEN